MTADDVKAFALVTHDYNPAHLDNEYAEQSQFKGVIAWYVDSRSLSALIGNQISRFGDNLFEPKFVFRRPVHIDDILTATFDGEK